ncbi:MAG: IS701 family transposase [bacterium]
MDNAPAQRTLGRVRLEARRFLKARETLFTRRPDGRLRTRWSQTWKAAAHYFGGLLTPGPSKNMRSIARHEGVDEDQLERFVRDSPWEYEAVQEHLVRNVPNTIQSPNAVIIIDDYGLIKQGRHSVGVQRQYSGAAGKTGNCQVAVNVTYAQPGTDRNADQATWPLGTRLYLPQPWVEDPSFKDLRRQVRLPKRIRFQTKNQIAQTMVDQVYDAKVPHVATTADAGYGRDSTFRRHLRERNEPYVMGLGPTWPKFVRSDAPVQQPGSQGLARWHYPHVDWAEPRLTPPKWADGITDWKTVTWGQGTKRPLTATFARIHVRGMEPHPKHARVTDETGWLLLERRGKQLKAYLCWGLDDHSLEQLVAIAHLRWTIEQFHREAKGLIGLDRFEGRTWNGWNHHTSLVLLAYAFLSQHRAQTPSDRPPLSRVASALVLERSTQDLLGRSRLKRGAAQRYADIVLRRAVSWYR